MKSEHLAESLRVLETKRILFAHQSVGRNVLDGIQQLTQSNGRELPLMESRDVTDRPGIVHFAVGRNRDPLGKIRDFVETTERQSTAPDVVMLKLCYLDFDRPVDEKMVAQEYLSAMKRINTKFPGVRVVAWTTPLTTIQTGPKAWIKRLLGRSPSEYDTNARRYSFNEILRKSVAADQLFDVAKLESTASGAPATYEYEGQPFEALDPAITDDGGHLNERGQQLIASALIDFLAKPSRASL